MALLSLVLLVLEAVPDRASTDPITLLALEAVLNVVLVADVLLNFAAADSLWNGICGNWQNAADFCIMMISLGLLAATTAAGNRATRVEEEVVDTMTVGLRFVIVTARMILFVRQSQRTRRFQRMPDVMFDEEEFGLEEMAPLPRGPQHPMRKASDGVASYERAPQNVRE